MILGRVARAGRLQSCEMADSFGSSFIGNASAVYGRRSPAIDVRMVATREIGVSCRVMPETGAIVMATRSSCRNRYSRVSATPRPGRDSRCRPRHRHHGDDVRGRRSAGRFLLLRAIADGARSRPPAGFPAIMAAAYDGIPPDRIDRASALMTRHAIAVARSAFDRFERAGASRALRSEPTHRPRGPVGRRVSGHTATGDELLYFVAQRRSQIQAQQQAVAWIGQQARASFVGARTPFGVLMPIACRRAAGAHLRNVELGGAVHVAH
jgi:hypothetical protein